MNEIIKILMERDEMSKAEAIEYYKEVKEMIDKALEAGEMALVEEIMYGELGLEMDYIFDII